MCIQGYPPFYRPDPELERLRREKKRIMDEIEKQELKRWIDINKGMAGEEKSVKDKLKEIIDIANAANRKK